MQEKLWYVWGKIMDFHPPVIFTDSVWIAFDRKTWQWAGKVLFDVILPSYYSFHLMPKKSIFDNFSPLSSRRRQRPSWKRKFPAARKKWHEKSSLVMISIIFILKEHDEKRCCHIFLTATTFHWILGPESQHQEGVIFVGIGAKIQMLQIETHLSFRM